MNKPNASYTSRGCCASTEGDIHIRTCQAPEARAQWAPRPKAEPQPVAAAPVTDDDLWAVPAEHRDTIARWLLHRAASFQPAPWLASDDIVSGICGALSGAAVDLAEPGVDDTTIEHAQAVLARLAGEPAECPTCTAARGTEPGMVAGFVCEDPFHPAVTPEPDCDHRADQHYSDGACSQHGCHRTPSRGCAARA